MPRVQEVRRQAPGKRLCAPSGWSTTKSCVKSIAAKSLCNKAHAAKNPAPKSMQAPVAKRPFRKTHADPWSKESLKQRPCSKAHAAKNPFSKAHAGSWSKEPLQQNPCRSRQQRAPMSKNPCSEAHASHYSKALAGLCSKANAGLWSKAHASHCSKARAGLWSKARAGLWNKGLMGSQKETQPWACYDFWLAPFLSLFFREPSFSWVSFFLHF